MTKHEVVIDRHTFHPQTLDPRSAGRVTRYHTWERIREQSVGEHTWQLLRIILAIHPQVSRELLIFAMFHDIGERVTGDVPFPVKREHPEVKVAFDRMEHEAQLQMATSWGVSAGIKVPHEELTTLKLAEFIEMMEWGLDEMALGNHCAELVYHRCLAQASAMLSSNLPAGVSQNASRYIHRRLDHERKYRCLTC